MYRIHRLTIEEAKDYVQQEKELDETLFRDKDDHDVLCIDNKDFGLIYYGLEFNNELVGIAMVDHQTRHLYRYHIGKNHRCKGHGLRFLFKLRVESLEVRRDNESAIRVYQRYGMVEDYEESNSVVMTMVKPFSKYSNHIYIN